LFSGSSLGDNLDVSACKQAFQPDPHNLMIVGE
jgi:hypothetical protein